MENNNRDIVITDKDGKKLAGKILFVFEANGDNFALYQIDDHVYAGKIDEQNNLKPVEEDEWKLVEKVFNQYMEEQDGN